MPAPSQNFTTAPSAMVSVIPEGTRTQSRTTWTEASSQVSLAVSTPPWTTTPSLRTSRLFEIALPFSVSRKECQPSGFKVES